MKKTRLKRAAAYLGAFLAGGAMGLGGVALCEALWDGQAGAGAVVAMLAFLFLGFFLHLILHECGHLIFGALTGYRFVSFRVGSAVWTVRDGRPRLGRYRVRGTAGQCLMEPPDVPPERTPYGWYNLGGVLVNGLLALLALAGAVAMGRAAPLWALFLGVFAFGGFYMALVNGIPTTAGGVPNDGHNALNLGKEPENRRYFYIQLAANARQQRGATLTDLDEDWFRLPPEADFANSLLCGVAVLRLSRLMQARCWDEAAALADRMLDCKGMAGLFRMETACERLYLAALAGDGQTVQALRTKEVERYRRATGDMPARWRLSYALALFSGDKAGAQAALSGLERALAADPSLGDARLEAFLADQARARLGNEAEQTPESP